MGKQIQCHRENALIPAPWRLAESCCPENELPGWCMPGFLAADAFTPAGSRYTALRATKLVFVYLVQILSGFATRTLPLHDRQGFAIIQPMTANMHFRTAPPDPDDPLYRLWSSAATNTNQADPFCSSPAWQLSFHAAFAPERRLFVETSAQSLVAFAETAISPDNIYLTPIEPHWFFACPLLGKEAVSLLARASVFFAGAYRPYFPKIIISGIRPGGVLARRLIRDFADDFALYLHSVGIQSAASLHGGVDGYLSRRSGGHRSKLKKAARRASEQGVSFERVIPASAEEAAAAYARMLAVEKRSWKGLGRCGMAEPPARLFYEILLQKLAGQKAARIIFAGHEGEDIGFIFGGKAGNIYRGQQFSFSAQWGEYSIGNLMQMEQIRWLCEEGAKRYDMGPLDGPRMEYKNHWTEKAMEIQTWVLVPKG